MTVDELIKELQEISNNGKGDYRVIDGEYGIDVEVSYFDGTKTVFIT